MKLPYEIAADLGWDNATVISLETGGQEAVSTALNLVNPLLTQIAALREALELLTAASEHPYSSQTPEGHIAAESIMRARASALRALAQPAPVAAIDAVLRAHVESLKGSSGDVALVRMTRCVVEDFGARTADGRAALSYRFTDNDDGTSDLLITRTEDRWLDALKREVAERVREACASEVSPAMAKHLLALDLAALVAEARHE